MIRLGSVRLFPLALRFRSTTQPSTSCAWHSVTRDTSRSLSNPASARRRAAAPHAAMVHQDSEGTSKGGLVLGIESSCDDTGVAVVRACDGAILGQAIANQVDVHAPWGGVVPKLAQEAHEAAMDSTVESALQQAGVHAADLEAVAVTVGPGLSLCLKVGVQKARQLAAAHGLKYVAVHHMEAHALVVRASAPVTFPFLCLLVSGGHNLLVIVHGVGRYSLLGSTLDDAVGEAYDKVARLLGLELRPSGGAAVEALAQEGDEQRYKFSMPLRQRPNCNFSYAGLKTAVRLAIEAEAPGPATDDNRQVRADIAASFQRVALAHLEERTRRAAAWALDSEPAIRHLVVAGGVAANKLLRSKLQGVAGEMGLELVVPAPQLCTDNGVMVAWAGVERLALGLWEHLPASSQDDAWVDVRPRWPLTDQRDSRSLSEPRSERKKGIYTSLTALTEAALCVANGRQ